MMRYVFQDENKKAQWNIVAMNTDWLAQLAAEQDSRLRRYLRGFTSCNADIDDWIQEALLRVFAASKTAKLDNPAAYLFRIARNVALKRLAHRKVKLIAAPQLEQMFAAQLGSPPPHQSLQNSKDLSKLSHALSALPDRCREVFILCKLDGYKHTEVAEQLGISLSTVEKHMVKALRHCRAALAPAPADANPANNLSLDVPSAALNQGSLARYQS